MQNEYSEVECTVVRNLNDIELLYRHNGLEYRIEIPKTDKNKHLKTGDIIFTFLGIEKAQPKKTMREVYEELWAQKYNSEFRFFSDDKSNRIAVIYAVENTHKIWRDQWI